MKIMVNFLYQVLFQFLSRILLVNNFAMESDMRELPGIQCKSACNTIVTPDHM